MGALRPTLTTERLTLKPVTLEDENEIEKYVSDIRVARMVSSITHPNPPGATRAFLKRVIDPENPDITWAIRQDVALLGVITLRGDGEIGYWLGPEHWGQGIMTEAGKRIVAYAFSRGDVRVHAQRFDDNPASGRVIEKIGMTFTGHGTPEFCPLRNKNVPKLLYERLRDG